jgi:hypothetical protein
VNANIDFRANAGADFAAGSHQGTDVGASGLVYDVGAGVRTYTDPHRDEPSRETWEWAAWTAPQVTPGFAFTSLVPSWNASAPAGSWLEVEARVSRDGIAMSRWYALGRWAESEHDIHPTSVAGQDDGSGRVVTEVLEACPGVAWSTYQMRIVLMRRPGSDVTPSVRLLGAVVAKTPRTVSTVSASGTARGCELAVPAYSQQLHRHRYTTWASVGDSWCSPTSTSMVLASWGRGPASEDYAWVRDDQPEPFVDHAAWHVYDHSYRGPGNWSFNTAYAALYGTTAFVTRLADLTEAELFIDAGIPLVAGVSFTRDQLDGADYDTEGHLLTIVGFDEAGNVISNDPASHGIATNDAVRTVYDRAQFEKVWLGSGGIVYVIRPPGVPLPPRGATSNPHW